LSAAFFIGTIKTMKNPRIFTEQPLQVSDSVELEPQASHHLASVLRMSAGDSVRLFNNSGHEYQGSITSAKKRAVTVQIDSCQQNSVESPLKSHLAISISKGDRMDYVIQKATELGVTEITPLITERTNVKLNAERLEKKQQHWQQIAISACEQCGRNTVPKVNAMKKLTNWIEYCEADKKLVLHHRSEQALDSKQQPASAILLIGPEGGLSEDEISLAESKGFEALTMGPRVLRTETAPLAALSLLQFCWGDF
jgi:16S rRNA (uracil1498-N3)-methyltransferase